MINTIALVAFYKTQILADDAKEQLRKSGFDREMLSTMAAKHEVLRNKTHNKAGNFMLFAYGTEDAIKEAAITLKISLGMDDVKQDYSERVLSGGESSSFQ